MGDAARASHANVVELHWLSSRPLARHEREPYPEQAHAGAQALLEQRAARAVVRRHGPARTPQVPAEDVHGDVGVWEPHPHGSIW